MKKLLILFESFPDYSGNCKSLYEYMSKRYSDKFELVWVVNNEQMRQILLTKKINCVLSGSKETKKVINNADVLFDTHGQFCNAGFKEKLYINLWHGMPVKTLGYLMNISTLTESDNIWLNSVKTNTDFTFVTSKFYATIMSSVWNMDIRKILPLGTPRLDDFYDKNAYDRLVEMLKCNIKKPKIIAYCPTFKNGLGRLSDGFCDGKNIINIKEYDEKKLIKFLKDNNCLLLVKYHPSELSSINKIEDKRIFYLDDKEMNKYNLSLNNILSTTDLLITDYSSVYIDYLAINKPIIFTNYDAENYFVNRGFIFDNSDFWFPGPKVNEIKDLIKNIKKLIKNKKYFSAERINFKKLTLTNYIDCSKTICDFIFDDNGLNEKIEEIIKAKNNIL